MHLVQSSTHSSGPDLAEIVLRMSLALVLGGAVGLEREWRAKAAGLRTHVMVALGAACFILTGLELYTGIAATRSEEVRMDPVRLVEGIAGGIGFIGAGAILRQGSSIRGLTTAGSLWLSGAIGAACGIGSFAMALCAALFGLLTLAGLGRMEAHLPRHDPESGSSKGDESG